MCAMSAATESFAPTALSQVGLVVHPRRRLDEALETVREWSRRHDVSLGQVEVAGQNRRVADPISAADCDLVMALGGDGTALAALHAAASVSRPVLGIACGSIGALSSVAVDDLAWALDEVRAGRWAPVALAGLEASSEGRVLTVALNDFVVSRAGGGQVVVAISADGVLYARVAGDGVVVATPHGSSAYSMAAGGPVLAPGADGFVATALAAHGASCPPLVLAPESCLVLTIEAGYGGLRFELDGQPSELKAERVELRLRRGYATRVELAGEEPPLTGLRRRGLVHDSPRVKIREGRSLHDPG
jgi:NAD+ kinase